MYTPGNPLTRLRLFLHEPNTNCDQSLNVLVYLLIYLHSPETLHALSLDSSPVFARRRRILATDNEKKYPDTSIILWNELPTAVLTYSTLEGFKDSLRQLSYIRHDGFNGIYHHDDGF